MTDPKEETLAYIIDFEPIGRRVEITPGESLLEAAHSAGVELVSICTGEKGLAMAAVCA